MKQIIVFDLDDTLYDELTYVDSGFRAVARLAEREGWITFSVAYAFMRERLLGGRGRIFDDLLLQFSCYSQLNVRRCLSAYRLHKPEIQLYPEAEAGLRRFRKFPLYIVTDGNKIVQQSKLTALGVPERVRRCLVTHRFGVRNAKPSPYCFLRICEWEQVSPGQVLYVGDNPRKDFVGIKPLGFRTVRILTGQHRHVRLPDAYEADCTIGSLAEFDVGLIDFMRGVK